MKINEFAVQPENKLNFDIIDDTIVFMRNDPQFYRKAYYPAVMKLADSYTAEEINTDSILGSMVDQGMNTYCKKFNVAKSPAEIFTLEDRNAIISRIAEEELDQIRQGAYQ